jgi:hypothetical protein
VDLRSADGPSKRAFDHRQRALAERLGEFFEELFAVGSREVLELGRADLRIDPLVGLAVPGGQRVVVSLDRVEPVFDALLDGVRGRRADAGVDLGMNLVEIVFDFRLGLAAYRSADALAVWPEAERGRKDPLFGTDRHIEGRTPVLGRAGGAVRGPGY